MVILTIFIVVFILIVLVHFVVTNIDMFQTSFDIVVGFYTLEGVEFVYIIGGSVLLGALVIFIGTWVLDTKRKIKLVRMGKELKRLEQAVEEAKSSLPSESEDVEESGLLAHENSSELPDSSTVTPEDITRSFEDSVEKKGTLDEESQPPGEESDMLERDGVESGDVAVQETELKSDKNTDIRETSSVPDERSPQKSPVEAELVDAEEEVQNDDDPLQENIRQKRTENE
jgi:uncharacterized membrane protein YciS (DUF1049 family)